MKPNFALNLSHDGITLLHRTSSGWLVMGEVALDAPDMAAELAELRKRATSVSTAGLATKLLIPNSQILYRALPDPGPQARDTAIRTALDGATPYALDQLVWDSTVTGKTLQIAVLARETLDEAENFATEHRFNPISFVAMPEAGDFEGEPFFGRARSADALIGPDTAVQPDREAMRILPQRPILPPEPLSLPELLTPAGVAPEAPQLFAEDSASEMETDPQTETTETVKSLPEPVFPTDASAPEAEDTQPPKQRDLLSGIPPLPEPVRVAVRPETDAKTDAPENTSPETLEDTPSPRATGFPSEDSRSDEKAETLGTENTANATPFQSRRESEGKAAESPSEPRAPRLLARPSRVLASLSSVPAKGATSKPLGPASKAAEVPQQDAPQKTTETQAPDPENTPAQKIVEHPHVAVTSGEVPVDESKEPKLKAPRPGKTDPLPEPPPMPAPVPPVTAHKPVEPVVEQPTTPPRSTAAFGALKSLSALAPKASAKRTAQTARKATPPADIGTAPLPRVAITAGDDIAPLSDRAAGLDRVENTQNEAEALTVFGARRRNREIRNKPRHLGLMLTGALVALLLLVGLIAGLLPEDEPQQTSSTSQTSTVLPGDAPAQDNTADSAGETDLAQTDGMTEVSADEEEPELTPELLEQATVPAPPAETIVDDTLDREALVARYAATGIWPLAPEADTGDSAEDDLSALYTASIDHDIASQDAVALPEAARHIGEAAPRAALPPAPPGTRYNYDEDGFIRATPEGTVTPDGIVVYAGRPASTPKPRPGSAVNEAVEAALAPPLANENDPVRQALAEFRPRLRPETLVENNEKANLGGLTRAELGRIAPHLRPASAQEIAQEDARASGENEAARTAPVVTASLLPKARPQNFDKLAAAARAAEAAAAAAADAATPRSSTAEKVTAQVPATSIPQAGPANVARAATVSNAINLRKLNLMGVYGSSSDRRALVRLPSGRFAKVKVGDKLDGGRVQSIGSDNLTYVKNGRAVTLEIGG
ncbi:hypothetical protein [Celeribacter persicus]|nr:hypothetical protein [Celeribacter persicus]